MTDLEEILARDLCKDLEQKFSTQSQYIECDVQGGGVHWQCVVRRHIRDCIIDCFNEFGGAEYYICFRQNSKAIAERRTRLKLEIIDSIQNWILVGNLSQLHQQFLFIDSEKRKLIAIGNGLTSISPRLAPYLELDKYLAGSYRLWFENVVANRNVCIGVDYENSRENFYFVFRGESRKSSVLFSAKTQDFSSLAKVIEMWIIDLSMPSQINANFPWIKLGKFTDSYEHGNLLEQEFVESWERVVSFYEGQRMFLEDRLIDLMIEFIESMKSEGFNRYLRAGQAHCFLILSRSKEHGYYGRGYLSFLPEYVTDEANDQQKIIESLKVSYKVDEILVEEFEENKIALTGRIRNLLEKLSQITIS